MRPMPSPHLLHDSFASHFEPAPELADWARDTFISENALLMNEDHAHLRAADIGFLWTNVENIRRERRILGTCQLAQPSGEKWSAAAREVQIARWFGGIPDFLITLDAPAAADMDDVQFMALVEHELYHAGQAKDKFGGPAFSKATGKPLWAMRAHDVEEFVGVVERYGATSAALARMVNAVNRGPKLSSSKISHACGACLRLVK